MSTVDEIAQAGITQLQAIVDAADAASADLRAQRDTLIVRARLLQQQILNLSAQIVTAEGSEAATARVAITNIKTLQEAPTRPLRPRGPM